MRSPPVGEPSAPRAGVRVAPRDMFEHIARSTSGSVCSAFAGIGVFDHFFDIGGHSLLAARLIDEIEHVTGLTAPLAALFVDDTIAGLARMLRERPTGLDAPIVTLNDDRRARTPLVFLTGALRGGGFYSRSLARALGTDQPMLFVQPHTLNDSGIPDTIEAMAADRIRALRAVRPRGPYCFGGFCNGAFVAFEMARQLIEAGTRCRWSSRSRRARHVALPEARRRAYVVRDRGWRISEPCAARLGQRDATSLSEGNGQVRGRHVQPGASFSSVRTSTTERSAT